MANLTEASVTEVSAAEIPTPTKVEPDIMSGSAEWQGMDNEALADFVIEGVKRLRPTAEAILDLRKRFTKLRGKDSIHGCRKGQWTKFCEECLGMTDRNARRLIKATGNENPAAKHDGSAKRKHNGPLPPWCPKAPSTDGYRFDLVISALQGYVRDGNEGEAVKRVIQLYEAGYKVWPRLCTFAEEEAGLSAIDLTRMVAELEETAKKVKTEDHRRDLLCMVKATMLVCRAKKSRAVDNAIHWFDLYDGEVPTNEEVKALAESTEPPAPIPDKAYDKHTQEGRNRGRGIEHFLEEKASLTNESDIAPFQPPQEGTKACPRCWGTGRVPRFLKEGARLESESDVAPFTPPAEVPSAKSTPVAEESAKVRTLKKQIGDLTGTIQSLEDELDVMFVELSKYRDAERQSGIKLPDPDPDFTAEFGSHLTDDSFCTDQMETL
jgi:hypothetical protein